jgi:hypothetical protein
MLLNLFAFVLAQDRLPLTYGTVVQLRNVGTALHLVGGPRDPSRPTSPWDFFGAFSAADENWYWTVNRIESSQAGPALFVKCGSLVRLTTVDHQLNLAVESFLTSRSFVGVLDPVDQGGSWNVSCDGELWGFQVPVQFKNIGKNCFLSARIDRPAHPTKTSQYSLDCTAASSDSSVWVADGGVFSQDDLEDPAYEK